MIFKKKTYEKFGKNKYMEYFTIEKNYGIVKQRLKRKNRFEYIINNIDEFQQNLKQIIDYYEILMKLGKFVDNNIENPGIMNMVVDYNIIADYILEIDSKVSEIDKRITVNIETRLKGLTVENLGIEKLIRELKEQIIMLKRIENLYMNKEKILDSSVYVEACATK